jgi:hypothetical protein
MGAAILGVAELKFKFNSILLIRMDVSRCIPGSDFLLRDSRFAW